MGTRSPNHTDVCIEEAHTDSALLYCKTYCEANLDIITSMEDTRTFTTIQCYKSVLVSCFSLIFRSRGCLYSYNKIVCPSTVKFYWWFSRVVLWNWYMAVSNIPRKKKSNGKQLICVSIMIKGYKKKWCCWYFDEQIEVIILAFHWKCLEVAIVIPLN